jgi:hypothetical protein
MFIQVNPIFTETRNNFQRFRHFLGHTPEGNNFFQNHKGKTQQMFVRVVFFDFHVGFRGWIVELGAESVDKVADDIGAFDDSIEEDLNVIVLFSD